MENNYEENEYGYKSEDENKSQMSYKSKEIKSGQMKQNNKKSYDIYTTTIIDHIQDKPENTGSCTTYKFRSRPPYEGFILILVIILVAILFIWWLNS